MFLPVKDVVFGRNSMYSRSPIGILLNGDIEELIDDVQYLPQCSVSEIFRSDPHSRQEKYTTFTCNLNLSDSFDSVQTSEFETPNLTSAINDLLSNSPDDILEQKCVNYLNCDLTNPSDSRFDLDDALVCDTLDNVQRDSDGRLIMPILWDRKVSHLLPNNLNLCKGILKSNLKKLNKNVEHLKLVDSVFKEQLELGIISMIDNIGNFVRDNPDCSFLGHMPIFKPGRETTKCRVVFLSNLCDRSSTVSHNVAIDSGPSLNRKISSAIILMRFYRKLVIYDIVKAFLAIGLQVKDSKKFCFLWVENPLNNQDSLVAYKMERLPFGLRCSPTILMLSLYYILMIDTDSDSDKLKDLKKSMYEMLYMDNGAVGADDTDRSRNWSGLLINCRKSSDRIKLIFSSFTPMTKLLTRF